ncbi:unnamed protein product [Meganyctiphanes norvegica]|uniref:BPTI/Kunitz inhibitor domain-containing protein n=1 Tax=Meganyctiphanes norvegica TaxID=48144 RepID=A0AAV2PVJ7_MEGNR
MMSSVSILISLALLGAVKSRVYRTPEELLLYYYEASSQCSEPKTTCRGRAYIPRFYYNSRTGTCDCFVYGGCVDNHNDNNFDRLDDCMRTCRVKKRLQTISSNCIRIFGAKNFNFASFSTG